MRSEAFNQNSCYAGGATRTMFNWYGSVQQRALLAVTRPIMRFVAIKSAEQQVILCQHRSTTTDAKTDNPGRPIELTVFHHL